MQMHLLLNADACNLERGIENMANISKTINPKLRTTITVMLLLSSFISLASQTMMVTALPVIQKEMHVSLTLAQWLTTGYTLIIGVVTPLSSNMYEKFRNRSVFWERSARLSSARSSAALRITFGSCCLRDSFRHAQAEF